MDDQTQLELPLDERYRKAEQFALDFGETPPSAQKPSKPFVCPGYCPTCPKCRESMN